MQDFRERKIHRTDILFKRQCTPTYTTYTGTLNYQSNLAFANNYGGYLLPNLEDEMKKDEKKVAVERYLSYIPMQGDDLITVDDDTLTILTLRRKQGKGSCHESYTIGNTVNALVGCGLKMKQLKARLISIQLEQNPGSISAEDAKLALGDGLNSFKAGYAELYGEDMLWRPAWRFEYQADGTTGKVV